MLEKGQILNDTYRIVRLIGEGGMGSVYEATHARLAGRYAVKVLLASLSGDASALAHFDREARITSSLQHPNIVQIIDYNLDDNGRQYLVMEYLQGETLTSRLVRNGPLPPGDVADVVEQVAAALGAAHAHGIVHRDLKPDNLILVPVEGRQQEMVKILDFGISKIRDLGHHRVDGPVSAALMGTPQYMSPEQCQGRSAEVDAATDQFALAAITYEMLSGHAAFMGDSLGVVLTRVLHEQPPPLGGNGAVEQVVLRGLEKDKRKRFPSVADFANALKEAVAPNIVVAPSIQAPPVAHPQVARMVAAAAVVPEQGDDVRGDALIERPPEFSVTNAASRSSAKSRAWGRWALAVTAVGTVGGVAAFLFTNGIPGKWRVEYNAVGAVPAKTPVQAAMAAPSTSLNVPPVPAPADALPAPHTAAAEAGAPSTVSAGSGVAGPAAPLSANGGRDPRRGAKRRRPSIDRNVTGETGAVSPPSPPGDEDATLPIDENFGQAGDGKP